MSAIQGEYDETLVPAMVQRPVATRLEQHRGQPTWLVSAQGRQASSQRLLGEGIGRPIWFDGHAACAGAGEAGICEQETRQDTAPGPFGR